MRKSKKKFIGSKEILPAYHKARDALLLAKDAFEKKCNGRITLLDKLRNNSMNDEDERRLSRAMARIVSLKNDIDSSWKDTLFDEFLEKK